MKRSIRSVMADSFVVRFVGRQENDVIRLLCIEYLSSKLHECRVRFLGDIFVTASLVSDKPAGFVHHRRDKRVGVVKFVGNHDPALLESIGIGNISRGIRVRCRIATEFFVDALGDTQ